MSQPSRRSAAQLVMVVVAALLLGACGVGPEALPRSLPVAPGEAVAPDSDQRPAGVLVELWFVEDESLVPVNRTTEAAPSDEEKIDFLEAGPTASESAQGLRTALTSVVPDAELVQTAEVAGLPVEVMPNQTAVVLGADFTRLPSQEQLLILGQVVLTLNDTAASSVVFVDQEGTRVGVPLPNGRLTSEPVTSSDYAQLIKS